MDHAEGFDFGLFFVFFVAFICSKPFNDINAICKNVLIQAYIYSFDVYTYMFSTFMIDMLFL